MRHLIRPPWPSPKSPHGGFPHGGSIRRSFPGIRSLASLTIAVLAVASNFGCGGDATQPSSIDDGAPQASFDAQLDPGSSSFLLTQVTGTQADGRRVDVELIGSNLVTDPDSEFVSIDVAIRNASRVDLAEPAHVWLHDFVPAGVVVLNYDFPDVPPPSDELPPEGFDRYGFDYSGLLGNDLVLAPGETSGSKTWEFHAPRLTSFAFAATANFGSASSGAVISGQVFHDLDGNGHWGPNEPPFTGFLELERPDRTTTSTATNERGTYRFAANDLGLHTVTFTPPGLGCPCEVELTTPNPLQVVIVPDETGEPASYDNANFGIRLFPLDGTAIVLTDLTPPEIRQDHYRIGDLRLRGDLLFVHVGFSGCQPDHDFTLFMSGGFRESNPVQAQLVLGHNDFGEECDAAFERMLIFDLTPLRRAYEEGYGEPGIVILNLTDPQGETHRLRYEWGPDVPGDDDGEDDHGDDGHRHPAS